jgi:hypothetical protein
LSSAQNGFLCMASWRRTFETFQVGANPDVRRAHFMHASPLIPFSQDGCRITGFCYRGPEPALIDSSVFWRSLEAQQPLDTILRAHYRQCVYVSLTGTPLCSEHFDPEMGLGPGGFDISRRFWTTCGACAVRGGAAGKAVWDTGQAG